MSLLCTSQQPPGVECDPAVNRTRHARSAICARFVMSPISLALTFGLVEPTLRSLGRESMPGWCRRRSRFSWLPTCMQVNHCSLLKVTQFYVKTSNTRDITSTHVTSGGVLLRGLAPGQQSSEEKRRSGGDAVKFDRQKFRKKE